MKNQRSHKPRKKTQTMQNRKARMTRERTQQNLQLLVDLLEKHEDPTTTVHKCVYVATELREPQTVKEALSCPEKEEWKVAMQKEMESIHSNEVWDLVELPKDRKLVGNKWVFKKKTKADGLIERYKARLAAQGFPQKQGLDYDETFSPVIRFAVWLLLQSNTA